MVALFPASFHFRAFNFAGIKDVYVPVGKTKDPFFYHRDVLKGMDAIGRLKPGVSLAAAQADMAQITRNLAAAYPNADKGTGAAVPARKRRHDELDQPGPEERRGGEGSRPR